MVNNASGRMHFCSKTNSAAHTNRGMPNAVEATHATTVAADNA